MSVIAGGKILAWISIAFVMAAVILIIEAGLGYFESTTGVPWMPFGDLLNSLSWLALISVLLSLAAWLLTRKQPERPTVVRAAGSIAWVVGTCLVLFTAFVIFTLSLCRGNAC
jgi:hypothetical protein